MASMKLRKPSQATLDYFERLAPGAPLATRTMFGMPCRFLNGYMLVGVFENTLMLHLSAGDRAECIAQGAEPFAPMGRDMKAYVTITPGTFHDHDLKWWIVRGMRHIATLPPRVAGAATSPRSKAPPSMKPTTKKTMRPVSKKAKPKAKLKAKPKPQRAKRHAPKSAPRKTAKKAARKAAPRAPKKAPQRTPARKPKRPAAKKRRTRR
jgi:TfoX/Sxy family transcriptional regulator of competence genes